MARLGRGFPSHPLVRQAIIAAVIVVTASDSAPAVDAAARAVQVSVRTASDSAPATDSASRAIQVFHRTASDSAPATDIAAVNGQFRSATDSAPATDTASRAVQHFTRTATDSAPAVDSTKVLVRKAAHDSAPATDTATRAVQVSTRSVADAAPATDTASRAAQHATRTAADSAPAVDAVGLRVVKTAVDSAPATDSASRAVQFFVRTASDAAPAVDVATEIVIGAGGVEQRANQNWPLTGFEIDFGNTAGPPAAPPSSNRVSINARYRRLVSRQVQIHRGRQYELDQVQAGSCTITIPDPLELLNPDNSTSPFNSGSNNITPYRPFWMYGVWPNQPGSGNLYNDGVLSSGAGVDPSFEKGTGPLDGVLGGGTFVTSTAQAFDGLQSVLVTQAGAGAGNGVYAQSHNVTAPDITYTASAYVYPTGGASVGIQVVDAAGNVHVGTVAATQNAWTRIFVAWTTVDTLETVTIFGTGTGTPTYYVDAMMLEFGAHLSTYVTTGPTLYPIFTGYCERWPTQYDFDGYRAVRPLVAVDALALLAQTDINQQYSNVIAQDNPQFLMRLDDSAAPPLITGNPPGFGTTTNVQGGSINFAGDTLPDGTPAVTLSQQIQQSAPVVSTTLYSSAALGAVTLNLNAAVNAGDYILIDTGGRAEWAQVTACTAPAAAPYVATITESPFGIVGLQLSHSTGATVVSYAAQDSVVSTQHHSAYSVSWAGATFEGWFRPQQGDITMLLAGENLSGAVPTGFNTSNPISYRDTFLGIQSFYYGLNFVLNDPRNGPTNVQVPCNPAPPSYVSANYANVPDSAWHYYAIKVYANPANPAQYLWKVYVDLNPGVPAPVLGAQAIRRTRFNEIAQVASTYTGPPQSTVSAGKIAYYPYALGDDRILAHAQVGFGYANEITGTRVLRLLTQYWGGPIQVAAGSLPMANDFTYDPTIITSTSTSGAGQSRTMLDVLQEVQESERGLLYVDRFGTIQFEDRASRYANQTALWTFGENPTDVPGVEYPYSAYETDFDPTYLFTQTDLTSPTNSNFLPVFNPDGVRQYGTRVLTQQMQAYSDWDMQQASIFYLTRYGQVKTRITKLTLNPAGNPALWPVVLSLDISQRIKIVRRSQSGVAITNEFYIEQIQHQIDPDTGAWTVDLQCSPVFVPTAWVLGDPVYGVLDSTTVPIY